MQGVTPATHKSSAELQPRVKELQASIAGDEELALQLRAAGKRSDVALVGRLALCWATLKEHGTSSLLKKRPSASFRWKWRLRAVLVATRLALLWARVRLATARRARPRSQSRLRRACARGLQRPSAISTRKSLLYGNARKNKY